MNQQPARLIVGFTGTRDGTTSSQRCCLLSWLCHCRNDGQRGYVDEFHHGACVGADTDAVRIATFMPRALLVVAHPPENDVMISRKAIELSGVVRDPLPYLVRNRAIVDASSVLLACPKGPEERRSGTWSTIRYARRQGKRVVIFWPDGTLTDEPARAA